MMQHTTSSTLLAGCLILNSLCTTTLLQFLSSISTEDVFTREPHPDVFMRSLLSRVAEVGDRLVQHGDLRCSFLFLFSYFARRVALKVLKVKTKYIYIVGFHHFVFYCVD